MPDPLESVKSLAAEMRRSAQSELEDPSRARRLVEKADAIVAVTNELDTARKRLCALPNDYGDLSDLPHEVVEQLNLSKGDELEGQMRDIIASANGQEIGIDPIIIELWRRHKVTKERRFIMNKLYRMGQKGTIEAVRDKKGVYIIRQTSGSAGSSNYDDLDDDIPF